MGSESTGTITWLEPEYKYHGTYTGSLKNGLPHGKGDFSQQNGRKHLVGEWVDGIKQGPFIRMYGNGFHWKGNYVNNLREGVWQYVYAGANPIINKYNYSQGHRIGKSAGHGNVTHKEGLKMGSLSPIM